MISFLRQHRSAYGARLFLAACLLASANPIHAGAADQKPTASNILESPAGLTEVGLLAGAPYRIDIPHDWNHSLVVFYHGYALRPDGFHIAEHLVGQQEPFFDRHYAVIQSAYSQSGWALEQAFPETEALRRYFVKKYGQPRLTYAAGGSMGGQLVAITMEINPKPYNGGLDLCGSVGPTYESFGHRFAMRAARPSTLRFPGHHRRSRQSPGSPSLQPRRCNPHAQPHWPAHRRRPRP